MENLRTTRKDIGLTGDTTAAGRAASIPFLQRMAERNAREAEAEAKRRAELAEAEARRQATRRATAGYD